MRGLPCALTALLFSSCLALPAATRIDDPKSFVTEAYRHLMADTSYQPPDDIYIDRLAKLLREDQRRSKGEVGCLDFVFWVNGQDWKITNLAITTADRGLNQTTVIAKFRNAKERQEIHFDFLRASGQWLLDEVHSELAPQWTLSKILRCTP